MINKRHTLLVFFFLLGANTIFGQIGQSISKEQELFALQKAKVKEWYIDKIEKWSYEYHTDKIVEIYRNPGRSERTEYYFDKQKRIDYSIYQMIDLPIMVKCKMIRDSLICPPEKIEYEYSNNPEKIKGFLPSGSNIYLKYIKYLIITDTIQKTEETYLIPRNKTYDFRERINYDSLGRRKSMSFNNNHKVFFVYDANNRVIESSSNPRHSGGCAPDKYLYWSTAKYWYNEKGLMEKVLEKEYKKDPAKKRAKLERKFSYTYKYTYYP
jgi:hypothetical protein